MLAWCGMRGAVALAAALAVPLETDAGEPFPDRDLLLFLTYAVILATLVLQGLTLPWVIRRLGVEDDGLARREELLARRRAAEAALVRIDELAGEDWLAEDTITRTRGLYRYRVRRFGALHEDDAEASDPLEARSGSYARFMVDVIGAQRAELRRLLEDGEITDDVLRRVERDLDLEEARLTG